MLLSQFLIIEPQVDGPASKDLKVISKLNNGLISLYTSIRKHKVCFNLKNSPNTEWICIVYQFRLMRLAVEMSQHH